MRDERGGLGGQRDRDDESIDAQEGDDGIVVIRVVPEAGDPGGIRRARVGERDDGDDDRCQEHDGAGTAPARDVS